MRVQEIDLHRISYVYIREHIDAILLTYSMRLYSRCSIKCPIPVSLALRNSRRYVHHFEKLNIRNYTDNKVVKTKIRFIVI